MEEKTEQPQPVPAEYQPPDPQPQAVYPVQQPYPSQPPAAGVPGQPPAYSGPLPVTGQPVAQPYPGQPVAQPYPGQPVAQPYPGQPGVVQMQPVAANTVLVSMPFKFTALPMNMQCSNCGNNVTTTTHKEIGAVTWLVVGGLCLILLGCALCPLGLIGLCIPAFKDTIHSCPVCKFTLGKHTHM